MPAGAQGADGESRATVDAAAVVAAARLAKSRDAMRRAPEYAELVTEACREVAKRIDETARRVGAQVDQSVQLGLRLADSIEREQCSKRRALVVSMGEAFVERASGPVQRVRLAAGVERPVRRVEGQGLTALISHAPPQAARTHRIVPRVRPARCGARPRSRRPKGPRARRGPPSDDSGPQGDEPDGSRYRPRLRPRRRGR